MKLLLLLYCHCGTETARGRTPQSLVHTDLPQEAGGDFGRAGAAAASTLRFISGLNVLMFATHTLLLSL